MKKTVLDLNFEALEDWVREQGQPAFRAKQIWQGYYKNFYQSAAEFSTLPKKLIALMEENMPVYPVRLDTMIESKDGFTKKALFALADGMKIETVLMQYEKRNTICVSTQVGCALGCTFCATGAMGFSRNLSAGEIVAQVLYFANSLAKDDLHVTNLVFMGMGEPFMNYETLMQAIRTLNDERGFGLGARRMTVSTAGVVRGIEKFADENLQVNLAISLHSVDDTQRSEMMPINRKHSIEEVLDAVRGYIAKTNRRVTFEWALIDGVNDTEQVARELAALLDGMLCHVNLIRLNYTPGYDGKGSDNAMVFQQVLTDLHVPCSVRLRRGIDIAAGCGQLAARN